MYVYIYIYKDVCRMCNVKKRKKILLNGANFNFQIREAQIGNQNSIYRRLTLRFTLCNKLL